MTDTHATVEAIAALREDPALFVETVLQATPQKWQRKALDAIAQNDRVAIKSGHGVGKTAFESWVVLWWLMTHYPCKVAVTANSAHQLSDVLWTEIDRWARNMPQAFKDLLEFKSDKISLKGATDSFAVARTSRRENPESLAGFHSPHMLFVVEEASGVPNVIFETASGALSTPGAKIIMCGNPTRSDGYFYDAFHGDRDKWHCITVSCEEGEYVDPKFIDEMADKYGSQSNVFKVRVLGEFPTQSDDVLLPLHLIEDAVTRDVEAGPTTPVVWGLDVARFGGDRSALAKRQGNVLIEPIKTWQNKDLMELAGIVLSEYDAVPYSMRPQAIYIDAIGLGAGLADRLRELDMPAVAVSVSETASLKDRFNRLRDELFWGAREWFEARDCHIPDDGTLMAELSGIRYKYLSTGKLKVESKDEMKRRGQRSPDVADAFVLTFAGQGAVAGGYSRGYNHNRTLKPKNSWVV
ncbi:MAG: terminase B [Candidatus Latescibacterota bacterium]